ncbi:MAG: virulence RhuM family protein, partial [Thiomonas sp.]
MTTEVPTGEVIVYDTPDGGVRVEVRLDRDTVWLTQRQMAGLFDTTPENVLMHLKNVFVDNELEERATTKDFLVVQAEGGRQVRRHVKHYNLDAIISVGYRVNSRRGVRFRQWATATLRDHLVQGYTLNHQRLEQNARELESALALVRKAASGEALTGDQGRGLVDI